jgi:hypothetical protein
MNPAESKAKVLASFPQAIIQIDLDSGYWSVRSRHRQDALGDGLYLGRGETDEIAWRDAEYRISTHAPMHDALEIRVWRFRDAPEDLQALSTNGGDEDWLAFVPDHLADQWIGWLESGGSFGCCDVDEFPIRGGVVRIGSHG